MAAQEEAAETTAPLADQSASPSSAEQRATRTSRQRAGQSGNPSYAEQLAAGSAEQPAYDQKEQHAHGAPLLSPCT